MTETEREQMRIWVNTWKETGEFLEKLRIEESRNADLETVILSLNDASESALAAHPPKSSSGLVEMQRIFMKLKR